MTKKTVFLDVDGTLIREELFPFKDDLEAMEEAAGKGHLFFLNTGRSLANIPPAMLELPFIKGAAAAAGAHILLEKAGDAAGNGRRFQTVYHKAIPGGTLLKVIAWFGAKTYCCILEGERDCYTVNRTPRNFTVRPTIPVYSPKDFREKSGGDIISKLTLSTLASEEERVFLEPLFKINNFTDYSEAVIKGENKARAMALILEKLGLRREDSIAIGDSANDLEMIRYAGMGIAMGNAAAELKAAAHAVTGDCGKGGIAQAIRNFVL